jgi:hypothetical protein
MFRMQRVDWLVARPESKAFRTGQLSENEWRAHIVGRGLKEPEITGLLGRLRADMLTDTRKACLKAMRSRYLTGEFSLAGAIQQLVTLGIELVDADTIARRWECETIARGKALPATKLVGWATQGIISYADLATRLMRLGYTPADVQLIVAETQLKARETARKAQERVLKAKIAASEKDAKKRQQQQQQAQTIADKLSRLSSAKRAKVEKQAIARVKAIRLAQDIDGSDYATAESDVIGREGRLEREKGFTGVGAITLVLEVIKDQKASKAKEWKHRVDVLIASLPDTPHAVTVTTTVPAEGHFARKGPTDQSGGVKVEVST